MIFLPPLLQDLNLLPPSHQSLWLTIFASNRVGNDVTSESSEKNSHDSYHWSLRKSHWRHIAPFLSFPFFLFPDRAKKKILACTLLMPGLNSLGVSKKIFVGNIQYKNIICVAENKIFTYQNRIL